MSKQSAETNIGSKETIINLNQITTQLVADFLAAKTPEEKEEVYKALEKYSPEELRKIEEKIKDMTEMEAGKIDLLILKLDILEREILEMMPEYPVSKKIAVIINGDHIEDRHIGNVKLAISTLQKKGVDEVFVAHSGDLDEFEGITQFEGAKDGIAQLFHN